MAEPDTYATGYAASRERFEHDTAEHGMTILRDDELYRHLRFQRPGSPFYWHDIVAWPGRLVICGDVGDWMFTRSRDMFEFFEASGGRINPWEWDLREWDWSYLWCCWAIVNGIARYRAAKSNATPDRRRRTTPHGDPLAGRVGIAAS